MSWEEFWVIFAVCAVTMLICRTVPLFVLKGRELPSNMRIALNLIPPAAFAALVANDLLTPGMFSEGIWPAAAVLVAAVCVVVIAIKSRSLLLSAVGGVGVYLLLTLI